MCSAAQACAAQDLVAKYVPGPVHVGPEIYAGALAGVIPFAIGSWEFGKRIVRPHTRADTLWFCPQLTRRTVRSHVPVLAAASWPAYD